MTSQTWLPLDNGIGGCLSGHHIHSLFYDTTTSLLHVSGTFRTEGNCITVNGFAKWDGEQFDSVATNLPMSSAFIQIKFNNKIYGSRGFNDIYDPGNYLGFIENDQWVPIEGSPDALIEAAFVSNNLLYLGGAFDECGGLPCNMVCSYDGQNFVPLVTDGYVEDGWRVQDIAFYQGILIAGGRYELLDEQGGSVWHLGMVNNGWMQAFDPPMTSASNVEALQVWGNDLYIGGLLTPDGATNYRSIVKWNGTTFTDLSSYDYGDIHGPVNERITDIELYNNKLYIAGWFDQLEGQPCQGVACYDGTSWECLNTATISSLWNSVSDIEIINDTLYMAGDFTTIGGDTLHCIAKLNQTLTTVSELPKVNSFVVYPNPTSDIVTLEANTNLKQSAVINIYDSVGKNILTETWLAGERRKEICLEKFNSGIYMVTIKTTSGWTTHRLVKN